MGDFVPNEGNGGLFKNKKTKDNQPDYTGNCQVGGQVWRIAAWIKETSKGQKMMSLKFSDQVKREREDDIPF